MPPDQQLVKLTNSEDEFLGELLRGRRKDVAVAIPTDMPVRDILVAIRSCCSMLVKLERASGWLAPVLGRLLAVAAANPEVYEKAGYPDLKSFEQGELLDKGIGRSTLWAARKIVEVFPELPLEEYSKIGSTKLAIAAKICDGTSDSQKKKILAAATEKSVEQFREFVESSPLSSKGETTGATFPLMGSQAEITELKTWLADSGLIDWAGTDRPVGILLAAIQSATSEFTSPAPVNGATQSEDGWA